MKRPFMTAGCAGLRLCIAAGSLQLLITAVGASACARPEPVQSTQVGGVVDAAEASNLAARMEIEEQEGSVLPTAPLVEEVSVVADSSDPRAVTQAAPLAGSGSDVGVVSSAAAADAGWASILRDYVTSDGGFRYAALLGDADARGQLQAYVAQVGALSLNDLTGLARLAALINAYNALTVESVLQLWPVESVLQEDGFFDARTHVVGGVAMTLNTLENDWIRTLGEPRIHFAVNCASVGCPALAAEPWQASTLEAMLEERTRDYVRSTTMLNTETRQVQVSMLFNWFAADFGGESGVREFVASRLTEPQASQVRDGSFVLTYAEYDWSLNGR